MPGSETLITPGSCDAISLSALLVGAVVLAALVARLPAARVTFLPAVLLPSWLICGSLAAVDIAVVATLLSAVWSTRRADLTLMQTAFALGGAILGSLAGAAMVVALGDQVGATVAALAAGATFLLGYGLGEAALIELARRAHRLPESYDPARSNIVASLLLLFPAYVLANTLVARGPVFFVVMLLLFVLALALIALYVSASTGREAVIAERARAVAAATGGENVPRELLEDRAMVLTHELRSPLTAILGYAGLLTRERGTVNRADEEKYLASIAASSSYMLRLVNDILDLQRLEAGSHPIQLRPVVLDRLLADALAGIQPRADEKQVRTNFTIEPELPPLITDELLLRRALDNLLTNAVKYTRSGDEIRLSARRDGPGIAIAVADTGIGLTREERDRLFERFFRGKRSEARVERGTGLGLTIVRETVSALQGEVRVESTLGEGSTFTIWLPSIEG